MAETSPGSISKDGSASDATGSVGNGLVHRWDVVVQGCIHGNMPSQLSTGRNLDLPNPHPLEEVLVRTIDEMVKTFG